jgi:hypothetical protein
MRSAPAVDDEENTVLAPRPALQDEFNRHHMPKVR